MENLPNLGAGGGGGGGGGGRASFNLLHHPGKVGGVSHFTDEETEAPKEMYLASAG